MTETQEKAKKAPERPKMRHLPKDTPEAPVGPPKAPEATPEELKARLEALGEWAGEPEPPARVPEKKPKKEAPEAKPSRVIPWADIPENEMKHLNTKVFLRTHSKLSVILSHRPGSKISDIVAPALDKALDDILKGLGYE